MKAASNAAPIPMQKAPPVWPPIAGLAIRQLGDLLSCTVVVSGASAWMEVYHDRMPVILLLELTQFDACLDGSMGADALKPASEGALREWLVSPRMNRTGSEMRMPRPSN
jgi:putative SOS response-associated peptidase YedK